MKIRDKLNESPINFFSDFFMLVIAVVWVIEIIIVTGMGIYSTVVIQDNYIWSELQLLVTAPITAGTFGWMCKNAGVHIVKAVKGEEVEQDFPEEDSEGGIEDE